MNKQLPLDDLQHILDHTRELWEEVRGQRIFVTGGSGFFGCWLLESFLWANDKLSLNATVSVLTRNVPAFKNRLPHVVGNPAVSLCEGDVRDFEFPQGSFSCVVHAAAPFLGSIDPLETLDAITRGTRRVLDFAVACGARKFLLTSSGAVYGRQPADLPLVPETWQGAPDPSDPGAAYSEGKRMAELLCAFYHKNHGIETTIARCFSFFGPRLPLDAHYAAGNFLRDALAGGPIVVNGDGTPVRSYLYAADLAIWLWTILFKGKACHPYNTGSEETMSIAETAAMISEISGLKTGVIIKQQPVRGAAPSRYVGNCTRARKELSLRPWISIERQIQKSISWHEESFPDKA